MRDILDDDFHNEDSLLDGLRYKDLLVAVVCNEPVINEATVMKNFEDMKERILEDAEFLLEKNMKEIIKRAKKWYK